MHCDLWKQLSHLPRLPSATAAQLGRVPPSLPLPPLSWPKSVVEKVVAMVVVVANEAEVNAGGQSPIASSSSFVFAPEMQVPSRPLVVTALLQPHSPVQSFPHLITLQGSGAGAAVGAGVGAAVGATAVPSSEVQVLSPTVFGLALLARFAHSSQVWPPMLHPLQSGHPTPRMQVLSEQRGLHRAVGE